MNKPKCADPTHRREPKKGPPGTTYCWTCLKAASEANKSLIARAGGPRKPWM